MAALFCKTAASTDYRGTTIWPGRVHSRARRKPLALRLPNHRPGPCSAETGLFIAGICRGTDGGIIRTG